MVMPDHCNPKLCEAELKFHVALLGAVLLFFMTTPEINIAQKQRK